MEDIDEAILTLQERSRCTDLDQVQKPKRKFEVFAGSTAKESLTSEGMLSIHRLNEETKTLVQKVDKLLNRGEFSGVALDAFEEKRGDMFPTCKLAGDTTARRNMEKIYDLINGDVKKIGVYGMGGIGKTTVITHINNRILKEKNEKFNRVIWVTVSKESKESTVFKLQQNLGFKLNVDLSNDEDSMTRAAKLFEAFQKIGRYLLILDDLWEAFGLEKVGLPDPDYPSFSNGGKLVLTTRSLDVCRIMNCKPIKMDLLSEKEAWDLFLDHVGSDVLQVKDLKPIMRDVASECGRLPLAIAIIATSMRGNDEACDWWDALAKLREFSKEPGDEGKRIMEQLKFSYDRLKNEKLQKCFLLCALYPEDFCIERRELVELLVLEGIIEEKDSKKVEIDRGNSMLNKLINQCLLEGGYPDMGLPWVKMHDLVRDMALQIDGLHSQYKAISGNELSKLENVTWSKDLLKIHVSNCYYLDASPVCSRLTTFVLHDKFLFNIPNSFFLHLKALKVFSLSGCRGLKVLLNSISDLVNLVGLLLRDCCTGLTYVPSLARLKNLLTLKLSDTSFYLVNEKPNYIIKDLEELTNLRYLNIFVSKKGLPRGILPKLQNLRFLVCNPFSDVSVDELKKLKNLEMFKGAFHNIHDLRIFAKHMKQKRALISYVFYVGLKSEQIADFLPAFGYDSFDKVVVLGSCNLGELPAEDDMNLLFKDVQELEMNGVYGITSLCSVPFLKYAADLRKCTMRNCNAVRELVSALSSSFVLGSLEGLELLGLENLEAVIGGKMKMCNIFPCLKLLNISGCSKMKIVFDIALVSYLNNLETLWIKHCDDLRVIIRAWLDNEVVNESMTEISLPKLRHLELVNLPHLRSICPAPRGLICKSLREIKIEDCPQLEQCVRMPSHDDTSPSPSLRPTELKLYNTPGFFSKANIGSI